MKWASAIALAGVCVVAACGPKGGNTAAPGPGGTAAPAGAADVTVNMSDLPRPRAGLWQNTLDDGDGHPETITSCLSGQAPNLGKAPKDCAQLTFKRTITGAYVIDMSCSNPQFTMTAHTVASGDFQTQMVSDTDMTTTMPGQPPKVSKMHSSARWTGPCAPGQTPDDLPDNSTATN